MLVLLIDHAGYTAYTQLHDERDHTDHEWIFPERSTRYLVYRSVGIGDLSLISPMYTTIALTQRPSVSKRKRTMATLCPSQGSTWRIIPGYTQQFLLLL